MTWTEKIPRETEHYWPSVHAIQRKRERNLEWDHVSKTIEEGNIVDSHKEDCKLFIRLFEEKDEQLKVIANVETGEIITVTWIDKQDGEDF